MTSRKSIWYHLGLAYERARSGLGDETSLVRRGDRAPRETKSEPGIPWPEADELISAATWLVLDRVVGGRRKAHRPGIAGLLKAGAAGAAAALLVELVRPLLHRGDDVGMLDAQTVDRLIAGVGQGLVYGALVEPRVPGSPLVKGALYGSVEYATDPMGGLAALLGPHTPQGKLPVVGDVLDGFSAHDRAYLEHLVYGIALALLYEPDRSSSGTRPPPDEGEE